MRTEGEYRAERRTDLGFTVILLAPGTALVAGALALPLLLVLYLLKLRRRPVRVSSIRFWPVAAAETQANVPWRMVRPSWLLAMHLLILALLVVAAGRPAMDAAGGSGEADRVVLLVDVSASMAARDGQGGTRLDKAKARALNRIESLRGERRSTPVAVVAFAREARVVADYTTSRAVLRDAIAGLDATDAPGDLRAALALVAAMHARGDEASVRTILISDGGLALDRLAAPGPVTFDRVGPPPDAPRDNVGIVNFAARRDAAEPSTFRVFIDLLNTRRSVADAAITLSLNGEVMARRAASIPAAGDEPGRSALTIDVPSPAGGIVRASITPDDALASDNAASLVLPAARRPSAWLVRPEGDSPADEPPGAWLLREAMAELRLARLDRMNADTYASRLALGEARGVDLVVFDRVSPISLPPGPSIHFGAVPSLPGLTVLDRPAAPDDVVLWERTHPILRYVSLDTLSISAAVSLRVEPAAKALPLARGANGPLLLLMPDGSVPRLVAAFDLSQTNWPLLPGFPVFLASAVDTLTNASAAEVAVGVRAGDFAPVIAEAVGEVVLQGPDELRRIAPGPGPVSVGPLVRTGVYAVGGAAGPGAVAVNLLDARESALATRDDLPIERAGDVQRDDEGARHEVWHFFAAAAFVLLLAEWLLYAAQSRA